MPHRAIEGLLLLAALFSPAVNTAQAQPAPDGSRELAYAIDPESEAREAVDRAAARFEQGDYETAALEFERAYRLLEPGSRRNAVLNNLAVCRQRMLQHVEALGLYQRYLQEADPLPDDRAQVEQIMRGLRDLIGELHVTSNVPAEVWVDESRRGTTPVKLELSAGEHVLELRAEGYETRRTGITVPPRGIEERAMDLHEREVYRGAPREYFWSGVGLTSAALITGVALGARALALNREGERLDGNTGLATVEDEEKIHRLQVAADVMYSTAALLGVATMVLAFVTDFDDDVDAPERLQLGAAPGRSGGLLTLRGRF